MRVCQSDSGQYFMRSSGQLSEHIDRVCLVARFSEYFPIDHHRCIGGEHGQLLTGAPYGQRLVPSKSNDILAGRFILQNGLVDVCARNYVRHAYLSQQFAPSRRNGSEA